MARAKARPATPPPTYRIVTIDDLRQIPVDRIHDCLEGLEAVLTTHHHLNAAIRAMVEPSGQPYRDAGLPRFSWTDDGKRLVTVHFEQDGKAPGGPSQRPNAEGGGEGQ